MVLPSPTKIVIVRQAYLNLAILAQRHKDRPVWGAGAGSG